MMYVCVLEISICVRYTGHRCLHIKIQIPLRPVGEDLFYQSLWPQYFTEREHTKYLL